eukprot:4837127-Pyramimonas_sp.AAC.1
MKAQVISPLEDNSIVCVIKDSVGNNIDLGRVEQQISRVELAEAERMSTSDAGMLWERMINRS